MQERYQEYKKNQHTLPIDFMDKTEPLEKEIEKFPSLYIEGAAASGKTIAVKMLLKKHRDVQAEYLCLKDFQQNIEGWLEKINQLKTAWSCGITDNKKSEAQCTWVIFEDVSCISSEEILSSIADFIWNMPKTYKVILTGREKPAKIFLNLIWKRKMELLPQKNLLFSREDVRVMTERRGSKLHPDDIYEVTGGWPGCVDLMLRLAENGVYGEAALPVKYFLQQYEMEMYIRQEIINTLSFPEQEVMAIAAICPWLNEELCRDVFRLQESLESLQSLERKGLLIKTLHKERWHIAPLFRIYYENPENREKSQQNSWKYLGKWYEQHGYIKEAMECFRLSEDEALLYQCMLAHFEEVPFLDISWDEVVKWKESIPGLMYLRGMYFYSQKDFKGLRKEMQKLERMADADADEKTMEILLNLLFVMPEISLEKWLDILEHKTGDKQGWRLYGILGNSCIFLNGLRDLTELFACSKNEEKRREGLWKEKLDADAQIAYQLAKAEYYWETGRENQLDEEYQMVLRLVDLAMQGFSAYEKAVQNSRMKDDFCLAGMNLLCKFNIGRKDSDVEAKIKKARNYLILEGKTSIAKNAETVYALYSQQYSKGENLVRWIRYSNEEYPIHVNEQNYVALFFKVRGYVLYNQYEKAEKILASLIPYLQAYRRTLFLTEALFLRALVNKGIGQQNRALRSTIESFVACGNSRYVRLYTKYGKKGKELLEQYIEWMKNNAPGGWSRKKKYNYGNVLRMPMEDYLETILRLAKKEVKNYLGLEELEQEERLTMMETVILQHLSHGLTNAEICEELNLKLPTVKTHIYSLYKKMGVNSRTQAIIKGKEMGLVK